MSHEELAQLPLVKVKYNSIQMEDLHLLGRCYALITDQVQHVLGGHA
jgi:hypothetical protein